MHKKHGARHIEILTKEERGQNKPRLPASVRIVLGLITLIAVGTLSLMLPFVSTGESLTFMEAFFTATSALTVTGLSVITASTDLTFSGQLLLLLLIQVGGVGYMFVAALAISLLGRKLNLMYRLALSSSLGLDTPAAIKKVLMRSLKGIAIIEGAGAALLYWRWSALGVLPEEHGLFYAIFHSISAFCNAGFDLFNGLPQYDGIPSDNISLILLGLLIIIGGLGIPVLTELFAYQKKHKLSLHSRITLLVVVLLVTIGWVGFFVPEVTHGVLTELSLDQQLVRTWFHSVSTRTAGFSGWPNFSEMTDASQLLTMVLMFIGSAPASMGGGITTGTFAVLLLALRSYAAGHPSAQVAQRRIAIGTVRRAGAILTVGLAVTMLATWLLLASHGDDLTLANALFEVVSAFATCGLSLGATGSLNTFGQLVIIFVMFWGRLGAVTIVIAFIKRKKSQLVSYPEEPVLIG